MPAETPLPGGVAAVVRFFFQVPQWIQIGGAVFGIVVAALLLMVVVRKRRAILGWIGNQTASVRWGIAVTCLVVLLVSVGAGRTSWDYMQHDNDFCTGCHVMEQPFQRFQASEHDTLSCHDCHQQSIFASARQLYLWVAERPHEIGQHARLDDSVCERCHVTDQPETWQRIASTAGHRTHLESDSSALADVMCVTCHAQEVHAFVPVDSTCGQADCHVGQEITLDGMTNQTAAHCAACHVFTSEVPALATRDSAESTLTPNIEQCTACHQMQTLIEGFDPERDPHAGTCGDCHNPHAQENSEDALTTCATAGCHDNWEIEPFHVGDNHEPISEQCNLCHAPHSARVDASDCVGCHRSVVENPDAPPSVRQRLRPTLPFTSSSVKGRAAPTAARPVAARGAALQPHENPILEKRLGKGDRPPSPPPAGDEPSVHSSPQPSLALPDSFEHRQHETLACTRCHTTDSGHGGVTFSVPDGCQQCHHQNGVNGACTECHGGAGSRGVRITVSVRDSATAVHDATFEHVTHADVECSSCHTKGIDLEVTPDVASCESCHDDHHAPERVCADCHTGAGGNPDTIHAPPRDAHIQCGECHDRATIELLTPDRGFCATCHADYDDHYPDKECSGCHFQRSPDELRGTLLRGGV